jgi:hypothetical protein
MNPVEVEPLVEAEAPTEAQPSVPLTEMLVEKVRLLPVDKQRSVLDFVEYLIHKSTPKAPRQSARGLWADLDVKVTDEDLARARREMWGNFPRDLD